MSFRFPGNPWQRFCNTTWLLRKIGLLPVRQKYQTRQLRGSPAGAEIQAQLLVCKGDVANTLLSRTLLCPGTTPSLSQIQNEAFKYPGKKISFKLNIRETPPPPPSIVWGSTEEEHKLVVVLFVLHVFKTHGGQWGRLSLYRWHGLQAGHKVLV